MSYSVCFKCEEPVGHYQKYCPVCAVEHKQDNTFWTHEPDAYRLWQSTELRRTEIENDKLQKQVGRGP